MGLVIVPSDSDLAVEAFVGMKIELDKEKAAQIIAQIEIDIMT
jgi:hypothetical protein